jgi:4-hydroxybenzoate polyprenyltransferase
MDHINKPSKRIVGKIIHQESASTFYYIINITGVICGIVLSYLVGKWELSLIFIIFATMLYYYSVKYQYLTFWGNLTVSFLASAVIWMVWIFEFFAFRNNPESFVEGFQSFPAIGIFTIAYSAFALTTTMTREIIKDIQDEEGDARNGCMTIPVRYGALFSKRIIAYNNALIVTGITIFQVWLFDNNFQLVAVSLAIPEVMILYITLLLFRSSTPKAYGRAGNLMKIAMLAGLLSMVFVLLR